MIYIVSILFFIVNILILIEDIKDKEIRNIWLLILIAISFFIALLNPVMSFLGGILGLGIFLIAYFISKKGIGEGDLKLVFSFGLVLGVNRIMNMILLSSLISLPIAIVTFLIKKERRYELPYAPILIISFYLVNQSLLII